MHEEKQINSIETAGALLEQLAARIHCRWATSRSASGWVYGPQRDDVTKRHPCLMPYDELPESEKEFDRATARETIQALHELGYDIVHADPPDGAV